MGDHINTKKDPNKHSKPVFGEGRDVPVERKRRASFKHYLQNLEDDLMEQEMNSEEFYVMLDDEIIDTFITEEEADFEAYKLNEEDGPGYFVQKA
jgi:hypothetical protein